MSNDELGYLVRDLRRAANSIEPKVRKEIEKGAVRIRDEWRDKLKARRHVPTSIPYLPSSITYDTYVMPGSFDAEIGFDKSLKGLQGPLGNLLEFGAPNTPPGNEGGRSLRAEAPRLFANLAEIANIKL